MTFIISRDTIREFFKCHIYYYICRSESIELLSPGTYVMSEPRVMSLWYHTRYSFTLSRSERRCTRDCSDLILCHGRVWEPISGVICTYNTVHLHRLVLCMRKKLTVIRQDDEYRSVFALLRYCSTPLRLSNNKFKVETPVLLLS